MHISNKVTLENVEAIFTFHANPKNADRYLEIRKKATELATVVLENCPDCADRSAAVRTIREAVMQANASIALEQST